MGLVSDLGTMSAVSAAAGSDSVALPCGCRVRTSRDFLGRTVGTVEDRGAACPRADHQPGKVLLMPGREHARPE